MAMESLAEENGPDKCPSTHEAFQSLVVSCLTERAWSLSACLKLPFASSGYGVSCDRIVLRVGAAASKAVDGLPDQST